MTIRCLFPSRSQLHRLLLGAAAVGLLLASGCGKSDKSCPVSGQVLVNARPAIGVYIVFHPIGNAQGRQVSARTNTDGAFSLRVREPGEYAINMFWPRVAIEAGETVEGEDAFNGRYRDPKQPAQKVTIRNGDNSLPPIKLKFP